MPQHTPERITEIVHAVGVLLDCELEPDEVEGIHRLLKERSSRRLPLELWQELQRDMDEHPRYTLLVEPIAAIMSQVHRCAEVFERLADSDPQRALRAQVERAALRIATDALSLRQLCIDGASAGGPELLDQLLDRFLAEVSKTHEIPTWPSDDTLGRGGSEPEPTPPPSSTRTAKPKRNRD